MNKRIIIIIFITIYFTGFSQDLINKYKSGVIKLIPDETFALDNDWNNIFRSYYDTLRGNRPVGMRKSLVILPDGSLIVNHAYQNYHSKFSPQGKFEEEFVIESAGNKSIEGIINGNTLFTGVDNAGKMICTDLNGNYIKTLKLDYKVRSIIALSNQKFAVVGWTQWTKKNRSFIAIIDYKTNKEKIIWEEFSDKVFSSNEDVLDSKKVYKYTLSNDGCEWTLQSTGDLKNLVLNIPPQIVTINDKLIAAIPNDSEILIFDLNGNLTSKQHLNWTGDTISIQEQKVIQQKAIDQIKNKFKKEQIINGLDQYLQMIAKMEENLQLINQPLLQPPFVTIIKDSDGNVLFFEIPQKKDANIFHVWIYDKNGFFSNKCTFICDDYELDINSSKMVFRDGFIYGLQTLKNVEDNPLRLVRFKLDNK